MTAKIVIAGAGSIGCYVGGCLALAGKTVTFLARGRVAAALARDGLRVTDLDGRDHRFAAGSLSVEIDPENALSSADIVLVTVKSGATLDMAGLVDRYAPSAAVVISLQNGVENASRIAAAFATPRTVLAGMVPFNVVLTERAGEPLRAHRATAGHILVESGKADLAAALSVEGLPVETCADMKSVLWGKLLLNLNNALNALSDKPLKVELSDRRWRKLLAVADGGSACGDEGGIDTAGQAGRGIARLAADDPALAGLAVQPRRPAHAGHRPAGSILDVGRSRPPQGDGNR